MPKFNSCKLVKHSPQKMFDLVANVEDYPLFLPMCEALTVTDRKVKGDKTLILASMTIGYKLIRETFTTRVFLQQAEKKIDVEYVEGPFKHLENHWTFHETESDDATKVEFFIDYSFRNPLLSALMGPMFDSIFQRLSGAFEKRADELYGDS